MKIYYNNNNNNIINNKILTEKTFDILNISNVPE